MASQPQTKSRNRKIEPLNWRGNVDAPALKGLVSFLDVRPEDLNRGFRPVDTSSPIVDTSPDDNMSPVDDTPPVAVSSPVPDLSSMPRPSIGPKSSPVEVLSTGRTVYRSPQRAANMVEGDVPTLNRKIIRCRIAQDGHTPAEESVYKVLWDASTGDHTVRMGYAELAAKTRLSKKTISRLVPSLLEKLAIEVLDQYRSGELIPKNYKIFSYKEILDRRRDAGMEYVIRTKGVIFVTSTGEPVLGGREEIESSWGPRVVPSPVDISHPVDELSTGETLKVSECLNRWWTVDEAAAVQLIRSCREIRSDASVDEIVFFAEEKLHLARTNRSITNPTGFVLSTVPQCFSGQTFESFRARRADSLRIVAEEEERKGREARALERWLQKKANGILNDSTSSEAERG